MIRRADLSNIRNGLADSQRLTEDSLTKVSGSISADSPMAAPGSLLSTNPRPVLVFGFVLYSVDCDRLQYGGQPGQGVPTLHGAIAPSHSVLSTSTGMDLETVRVTRNFYHIVPRLM